LGFFNLEIISSVNVASGNDPLLEILRDGIVVGSGNVTAQTGLGTTVLSFSFGYAGFAPTSLSYRFAGGSGDPSDTVSLEAVRVNGQGIAGGNLSAVLLNQGQSSVQNIPATDYLFGRTDPTAADLGTVTVNGTGGNDTDLRGTDGADVIDGGAGDDRIRGLLDDDAINGGDGADVIFGEDGHDIMIGGAGNDTLYGNAGNDILFGQSGNDRLFGNDGDDVLNGGAGNDVLVGHTGNDILYGEDGDDRLIGHSGTNIMYGDDGADRIMGGTGIDTIFGGAQDDIIQGRDGNDILHGDDGDDFVTGHVGNDTLSGGAGNDRLWGGDGTDIVNGGTGADTIYGEDRNDTLNGDDGDDYINGGSGGDTINGGNGNDVLHGHGLDTTEITAILRDPANAGTVYSEATGSFYRFVGSSISWNDAQADAQATTLSGVAGHLVNITSEAENEFIYQLGNTNGTTNAIGGGGVGNRIWLSASDSAVDQDWFWMDGPEAGLQFSTASNSENGFYENWGSGQPNNAGGAQIYGTIWFNGGGNDDAWDDRNGSDTHNYVIEWHAGMISDDNQRDTMYGDGGNDALYGYGGNDRLFGGAGSDQLFGMDGNDALSGDEGDDFLFGGAGNDSLRGLDQNDILYGQDGNDNLNGGNNDDILYGGLGDDVVNGGNGDDLLIWDAGFNRYDGGGDIDTIDYSAALVGITVNLNTNANQTTVGAQIERVRNVENIIGGNFDDFIQANNRVNILTGNNGDDVFIVDGTHGYDDTYNGGAGNDIVRNFHVATAYTAANSLYFDSETNFISIETIDASGQDIRLGNATTINFTGLSLVGVVQIFGSGQADNITGSNADDVIQGSNGNDTVNGGNGSDTIRGGAGQDTLNGDDGNDVFIFDGSEGYGDTIDGGAGYNIIRNFHTTADIYTGGNSLFFNSATSFVNINEIDANNQDIRLANNTVIDFSSIAVMSEVVRIFGSNSDDDVIGSQDDDTIVSRNGDDVIDGQGGNDIIDGGNNDDTINGGAGDDIITGGAGADNLNGGTGNDIFISDSNQSYGDTIDGGAGYNIIRNFHTIADPYTGGNSLYFNGATSFVNINEIDGNNQDIRLANNTVIDFSSITTMTEIVRVLGSNAADNITGSADDDIIFGRNANDVIRGYDGNDTLYGGNNDDTLYGDDGDDILYANNGNDVLYGGAGLDQMYAGNNNDSFVFENVSAFSDVDVIHNFGNQGNDSINLADLLSLYDPITDSITDFVRITDDGTDSVLSVDADGSGGVNSFVSVASILSVTGLTDEVALEAAGTLVTS
jgi:Ca2+-binding RTX toxin-like protein